MPHAQRPAGDQLASPNAAKSPYCRGARRAGSGRADTTVSATPVVSGIEDPSGTGTEGNVAGGSCSADAVFSTTEDVGGTSTDAEGAVGVSAGFEDHQKFLE